VIGIFNVKRRQRLRFQHGPGPEPVGAIQEVREASEVLTPFTLPNRISQLRTPLIKSPTITGPRHNLNEPRSIQGRSTAHRDDSEGRDTMAQALQLLQERVAYLEGRSSGERARDGRLRRTSISSLSENTFGSEGTVWGSSVSLGCAIICANHKPHRQKGGVRGSAIRQNGSSSLRVV
jgi:hypothetical protein